MPISPKWRIRKGTREDSEAFVKLLVDFAEFEHKEPPDTKAKNRIIKDIFDEELANLLVASSSKKLVGYALYFYTYTTFTAHPVLYLEDIFVRSENRHEGIGKALFRRCVREGVNHGCSKMEWSVLTWNKEAIDFYEKLGAKKLELLQYKLDLKA